MQKIKEILIYILSAIFKIFAGGFAFLLVGGFLIVPIIAAIVIELLKLKYSNMTKAIILAYIIFGAYMLGFKLRDNNKE